MEWVETTAKTVEEAKELALDQLGVDADEAEFEVVETPRPGLFGRLRGEARVRSRVRPADVRPKRERRRRKADQRNDEPAATTAAEPSPPPDVAAERAPARRRAAKTPAPVAATSRPAERSAEVPEVPDEHAVSGEDGQIVGQSEVLAADAVAEVDPGDVGDAAVRFVEDLVDAMGLQATTRLQREDTELDVIVEGEKLGILIGPGGRTLQAIQNLARVAAQRRLGDHDTRLRIDVSGYRVKRKAALEQFATALAQQVVDSGVAQSLEPMSSVDRKIVHDVLTTIAGVESHSEGEDPYRRVVVVPVGADVD